MPRPLAVLASGMRFRILFLALVGWLTPFTLHAQREKLPPDDLALVVKQWPAAKKTSTGLRYVMLAEGTGPTAKSGDMVSVLYRGAVLNGRVFDENSDREHPFMFRLDRGMVIEGWDQGLAVDEARGEDAASSSPMSSATVRAAIRRRSAATPRWCSKSR